MTDQELSEKLGLSDQDIRDLQKKVNDFVNTLSGPQKQAFLGSLASSSQAAATLGPDVTAEHLETFMRERAPYAGAVCIFHQVSRS